MGFSNRQTGVVGTATVGTTVSATLGSAPTVGDTLTLGILFFDATSTPPTVSVADQNGNVYTVSSITSGATNMSTAGFIAQAYLLKAPSNAHQTVIVTFNKTLVVAAAWLDEFDPAGGVVSVDSSTTFANGASSTVNSPTITVNRSGDLLASVASDAGAVTGANSPWTGNAGGIQFGCLAAWDASESSNTAVNFSATDTSAWNSLGMSFTVISPGEIKVATQTGTTNPLPVRNEMVDY